MNDQATFEGTKLQGLVMELERMAERATERDHVRSGILDAIRDAGTARPFVGALRVLVTSVGSWGPAPDGSVVVAFIRDADLDVADKFRLLRKFLLREERDIWQPGNAAAFADGIRQESGTLARALYDVMMKSGRVGVEVLLGWLRNTTRFAKQGTYVCHAASHLLMARGDVEPATVMAAAESLPGLEGIGVACSIAKRHPREGIAFARRPHGGGRYHSASLLLGDLAGNLYTDEEIGALALALAKDTAAHKEQERALETLLDVYRVPPEAWGIIESRAAGTNGNLTRKMADRLADHQLEPLEVLERWMRSESERTREVLDGLGWCISLTDGKHPWREISKALAVRVADDLREVMSLGATPQSVGWTLEDTLVGMTDEVCDALGLESIAMSLADVDAECRKSLMFAVSDPRTTPYAWCQRVLARVLEMSPPEERAAHAAWVEERARVEREGN